MTKASGTLSALLPGLLAVALLFTAATVITAAPADDLEMLEAPVEGSFAIVGDVKTADIADLQAKIVFNLQESGDCYTLNITGGRAKFYRVNGDETTHIGTVGVLTEPENEQTPIPLTLQRRDWRMTLVWGDTVVARAYDSHFHDGECGISITNGEFVDPMIQPVGDIFVSDDFVREEGGVDAWEPLSGEWKQQPLRTDDQAGRQDADKSANAFSYFGTATDDAPAISVTGYWFWDVYSVQTALQPLDDSPVGLVIYNQDADNYIAVRWSGRRHPDGGCLEIVVVSDSEENVIAQSPGGFDAGQWYALRTVVSEGRIHVWVDDEMRLFATTDAFGQGSVGLYSESSEGCFFDDVVCGPWELFVEDFDTPVPGKWSTLAGEFQYADGTIQSAANSDCIAVTGRTGWENYEYSTNVYQANDAAAGLIVGYEDPQNYCILQWSENRAGKPGDARIIRVNDGDPETLAEGHTTVPQKPWHRASARLQDGLLRLRIDGVVQLEALALNLHSGAVGLFSSGAAGVQFDSAALEVLPPARSSRILQEFTDTSQHFEMAEWASTRAPWVKPDEDKDIWWTKGEYFGDHALEFKLSDIGKKSGEMTLIMGAREPGDTDAPRLKITMDKDSKSLDLVLMREDRVLAKGGAESDGEEAGLTLQRRSKWMIVYLDDNPVLHADLTAQGEPAETDTDAESSE
ncbi:MAG: hypothetical protein ACLFWB_08715 [Armatimonadota bacterium]